MPDLQLFFKDYSVKFSNPVGTKENRTVNHNSVLEAKIAVHDDNMMKRHIISLIKCLGS